MVALLIIDEGDPAIAADDDNVTLGVFDSGNEDDVVVGDGKTDSVDDGDDGGAFLGAGGSGGAFLGAGGGGDGAFLGAGGGGAGDLGAGGGGGGLLDEGDDGALAAVAGSDSCENVDPSETVTWRDCKRFCSDLIFGFLQPLKVIKLFLFIQYIHYFF